MKEQFKLTRDFKKWTEDKEKEHKNKMDRDINHRLDQLLVDSLSPVEMSAVVNLKKKIEPKIIFRIKKDLEKKVKAQMPDANKKTLERALKKRVEAELEEKVSEEMKRIIMTENFEPNLEWNQAREAIHRFLSHNKSIIGIPVK